MSELPVEIWARELHGKRKFETFAMDNHNRYILADFVCKAKAGNNHAGEQSDCDWPACGCDPYAQKVLDAIDESGFKIVPTK